MRAVVFTRRGGPDVLQVQERPAPTPERGEVLVDVAAAGISFSEILARVGLYPNAPDPPAVLGYEVAGRVSALGDGVGDVAIGERVAAFVRHGGYAEQAVARTGDLIRLPDATSFLEGAAIRSPWRPRTARSCGTRRAGGRARPDPRRHRRRRSRWRAPWLSHEPMLGRYIAWCFFQM